MPSRSLPSRPRHHPEEGATRATQRGAEARQRGQTPPLAVPQLGSCVSSRDTPHLETRPLVAQPLPRVPEPASSEDAQLPFHTAPRPHSTASPPTQAGRPPHVGDGLHVGQRDGLRHRARLPLRPCPGSGVRTAGIE
eukprot:scaffold63183_cov62-Phaeocystis_antarctica.AAC.4